MLASNKQIYAPLLLDDNVGSIYGIQYLRSGVSRFLYNKQILCSIEQPTAVSPLLPTRD